MSGCLKELTVIIICMQTSDINNRSGVMSVNIENRKTRSTESFEVRTNEKLQQPTKSPSRLPVEYFGIPLVDNDLPGNEVGAFFCSLRGVAIII